MIVKKILQKRYHNIVILILLTPLLSISLKYNLKTVADYGFVEFSEKLFKAFL